MGNLLPKPSPHVLVVDDHVPMQRLAKRLLELEGYRVSAVRDGESALQQFLTTPPDVVLLDVMLPGWDGYEVCRRIREFSQVPVVMVTAKGLDEERLTGFEVGADDYVSKPFNPKELVYRIRAVLRRTLDDIKSRAPTLELGGLLVDHATRGVLVDGVGIRLSATEYRLLSFLVRQAGRVLTVNEILRNVWGSSYEDDAALVHAYVYRLRQKIGDSAQRPRYIETRPGIGYLMRSS